MTYLRSNYPTTIDKLKTLPIYQDMTIEDKRMVGRYQVLVEKNNLTSDEQLELSSLVERLRDKMINSEDWNQLIGAVLNLETYFKDNVLDHIDNKLSGLNTIAANTVNTVEKAKNDAIANMDSVKTETINSLNRIGAETTAEIENTKDEAIAEISIIKNEATQSITTSLNQANDVFTEMKRIEGDFKIDLPILNDCVERIEQADETIRRLQDAASSVDDSIAKIESVGNKEILIRTSEWTLNGDIYEKEITHDLCSENLHVTAKNSDTKEAVTIGYKILDKTRILLKSDEAIPLSLILSASFYNPLITSNVDEGEIVRARKGESGLDVKIAKIDEQLDNVTNDLEKHISNHPSGNGNVEGNSHNHSNLAVLDKFNEVDGKLTYNNKFIKSDKGNNWVNAVECGIDNIGVKNCTEALQKLIDENTTVYLPNGIYLVDTITIPAFHTLFGESWNALIKQTPTATESCIKFHESACYTTLSTVKIQGVYNKNITNRHGVYLPSYVNKHGHFDSFNRIENISVTDVSGDGVHINTGQRGGTFRDVEAARCVRAGFRIMGSDNYVENVNCAVSGTQGIVTENGGWNNRFIGCKAYHAGVANDAVTIINEGVDLMKIVANFCNIVMDLQENRWGALKLSGSGNLMTLMIDACGKESYNKSDVYNNAETSVITVDNGANNNVINAMYIDGTLNAFARYYLNIGQKAFENVFNLEFKRNNPADNRRSAFDYLKIPCHHSNKITVNGQELVPLVYDSSALTSVNGNDGSIQWNVVKTNDTYSFTSNKSMSTITFNNWIHVSLNNKFTNNIVKEAVKHKTDYLYLSFDADSNVPENDKLLFDVIVMMASPTGGTAFTDPTQRYSYHGTQHYSIPMRNVKDDITEFNICVGIRNISNEAISSLPPTTKIEISNLKISFGDRISENENVKTIAENVMNNLVGGAS